MLPIKELKPTRPGRLRSFAACAYPVSPTQPHNLWWSTAEGLPLPCGRRWAVGHVTAADAAGRVWRVFRLVWQAQPGDLDHLGPVGQWLADDRCGAGYDPQPDGVRGVIRISTSQLNSSVGRLMGVRA